MCIRDRFYSLNCFWRQIKCLKKYTPLDLFYYSFYMSLNILVRLPHSHPSESSSYNCQTVACVKISLIHNCVNNCMERIWNISFVLRKMRSPTFKLISTSMPLGADASYATGSLSHWIFFGNYRMFNQTCELNLSLIHI